LGCSIEFGAFERDLTNEADTLEHRLEMAVEIGVVKSDDLFDWTAIRVNHNNPLNDPTELDTSVWVLVATCDKRTETLGLRRIVSGCCRLVDFLRWATE
jgi:hypothetical protein